MNSLSVEIIGCYGIKSLRHIFDFSGDKNFHAIYAQNGMMKTSFTNTFTDYSEEKDSIEIISQVKGTRDLKDDSGNIIPKENIFVIPSIKETFTFEKTSTILVNDKLRKEFEANMKTIEGDESKFISILRATLGRQKTEDAIDDLCKAFGRKRDDLYDFLEGLETKIGGTPIGLEDINYSIVFDEKVIPFIKNDVKAVSAIKTYISKYKELLTKTSFLRGTFTPKNAEEVSETLDKKGFFGANHGVILKDDLGKDISISNASDLKKHLDDDQDKLFSSKILRDEFNKLNKTLDKNQSLINFRGYITDNQHIIPELGDMEEFKRKVLLSIMQKFKAEYESWLEAYKKAKKEIERIKNEAKKEQSEWKRIIKLYHDKFQVPFELVIENQADILLKGIKIPVVNFKYKDECSGITQTIPKEKILTFLSTGEKRALYILNLIFEIEARKKQGLKFIIVIDDIADSFDYANKYAIIEYLSEIKENQNFYTLLLTHNFDFYRSTINRLGIRSSSWMTNKSSGNITLTDATDLNVFDWLRSHYHLENSYFISMIPFVRNLIEYGKGSGHPDYIKLTEVLHVKPNSGIITTGDIKTIVELHIDNSNPLSSGVTLSKPIHEFILEEANIIQGSTIDDGRIFGKIILSIAIRIIAEKYMITKISNPSITDVINGNQTRELYKLYETLIGTNNILKRVLLVTSENIHLNSFMYEPILDMGYNHLRSLYQDVKSLT